MNHALSKRHLKNSPFWNSSEWSLPYKRDASQIVSQLLFEERLSLAVDREWNEREGKKLKIRLREAKLKMNAAIEDIDFLTPLGVGSRNGSISGHLWMDHRSSSSPHHWSHWSRKKLSGQCLRIPGLPAWVFGGELPDLTVSRSREGKSPRWSLSHLGAEDPKNETPYSRWLLNGRFHPRWCPESLWYLLKIGMELVQFA